MKPYIYVAVRESDGNKHLYNIDRGVSVEDIQKMVLEQLPTAKTILIQVK